VFWEERGLGEFGGKVLVGDQLGLLAQAPRLWLQFWSQPRCRAICGLIPVRKSRKETSLAVCDKGALLVVVVGVDFVNMTVAIFYSGNEAAKFAEICAFT